MTDATKQAAVSEELYGNVMMFVNASPLTRKELATRLEMTAPELEDLLSRPGEWTLETVSDLMSVVGSKAEVWRGGSFG